MSETPAADSEPGTCEVTSADLDIADGTLEFLDLTSWSCSRPVWDDDRCVWHADATDKPPEELAATIEDGELHGAQLSGVGLSASSVPSGTGSPTSRTTTPTSRTWNILGVDVDVDADETVEELVADIDAVEPVDADEIVEELEADVDADETVEELDETFEELEEIVADIDADLSNAGLADADLSNAYLHGADLSNAVLTGANLSNAYLHGADLSNAVLDGANLSNAVLTGANLSNAYLHEADLSNANLYGADLSNKDLSGANLSRAYLAGVSMDGMSANQATTVGKMCTGLSDPREYDRLAQGYHELKQALSEEGLSQRARQARALEQQARTAESWARFKQISTERISPGRTVEGVRQWVFPPWPGPEIRTQFLTSVGGTLSRYLTGYGTRPLYVLLWTAAIVLLTTALFALGPAPPDGGWEGGPIYYSVVTFVTAPPHPPRDVWTVTQAAVLLETYLGTALIVLLGYVLGTRERV